MGSSYQSTAFACYLGYIVQAIVINLTPILFIPLREQYNLSYTQLGMLVFINFVTQVVVDVVLSGLADKHGYRGLCLLGQSFAILGLAMFALTPHLFSNIYLGLVIATITFSGGGGLMEMLLSPIVDSFPEEVKIKAMSLLHSFYAWGQLAVIVITTILLFLLGSHSWSVIVGLWLIIPIITLLLFIKVPLAEPIAEESRMKPWDFIKHPYFLIAMLAILFGAAAEVSMAQWASAFFEKGLNLPKISGDLVGVASFACMLGVGRAIFGKYGARINLHGVLIYGSLLAAVCYLVIALSPIPWISAIFCGLCGILVCLLWPGTLVISSEKFPMAGAVLFALLAASGDIGAAAGPWVISFVTDSVVGASWAINTAASFGITTEQLGLRIGMLVGIIFPLACLLCHIYLKNQKSKK
jgi:MFS family permease